MWTAESTRLTYSENISAGNRAGVFVCQIVRLAYEPVHRRRGRVLAQLCAAGGSPSPFVYDCLRVFRRVVVHGTVMISLEDLFYWVFVSFRFFYLLYSENDGTVRVVRYRRRLYWVCCCLKKR